MNDRCTKFRALLEGALSGRPDPQGLAVLGWHEHLLSCGACCELLEREEALELLLASLPRPELPPDLARRVVLRLRRAGDLDALLALDEVLVPPNLSNAVRERLRSTQADERLDRLLDLAGEVSVPDRLAARVLAAVRAEGDPTAVQAGDQPRGWLRRPVVLRAAAAVLVATGAALLWRVATQPSTGTNAELAKVREYQPTGDPTDDEVIAHLAELLAWRSIEAMDPLERDLVVGLDLSDEALLDAEGS